MKIALSPDAREADTARPAPALWQLGFRPFYLLASVFAALSIGLWAAQFAGWLDRPYLSGPLWHAHEMLFGFALAVVVGFLFTAGRNWSTRPTPTALRWPRWRSWAGRARSRCDAVRLGRCRRRQLVRAGRGDRPRDPAPGVEQPSQLRVRRLPVADGRRESRLPPVASRGAACRRWCQPARRPRHDAAGHGADGRPGDSHVHQQRDRGRRREQSRRAREACARLLAGAVRGRCVSGRRRRAGLGRARLRSGARLAPGFLATVEDRADAARLDPPCRVRVDRPAPAAASRIGGRRHPRQCRDARPDGGRHRRADDRHDGAHDARPHGPAAGRRPRRRRMLRARPAGRRPARPGASGGAGADALRRHRLCDPVVRRLRPLRGPLCAGADARRRDGKPG